MAHIFNIYFSYNNENYSAIVSVRQTPFFTEYILKNLSAEIFQALPGVKIISPRKGELFFENHPQHTSEVAVSIIQAVASHLQLIEL